MSVVKSKNYVLNIFQIFIRNNKKSYNVKKLQSALNFASNTRKF